MENDNIREGLESGRLMAVPKWLGIFTYINPALFVSIIFYGGVKFNQIQALENEFHEHQKDKEVHLSYERATNIFVPRMELEYRLEVLQKNQEKMMRKMNIN